MLSCNPVLSISCRHCFLFKDPGEVHGSLSVLLDSALCAISPLLFLTSQVPEMDGCSRKTQVMMTFGQHVGLVVTTRDFQPGG